MRNAIPTTLLVLTLLFLAANLNAAPPACVSPGIGATAPHRQLFVELNQYRQGLGLPPLIYSKTLELAANEHAMDMAQRRYFDHIDPDGKKASDRALKAGFCHRYVGENIYWGQNSVRTPSEAMAGWKRSEGHDKNMRNSKFKYVGMGLYKERRKDGIHTFWVQVFGFERPKIQQGGKSFAQFPRQW